MNPLLIRRRGMMQYFGGQVVDKYLTFTAKPSGSVQLYVVGNAPSIIVEYTTDGINWQTYTIGDILQLNNDGDFVKFRGVNTRIITNNQNGNRFKILGDIEGTGDVTSLLNGIGGDHTLLGNDFMNLFKQSTGLITAPNLPSKITQIQCYYTMFDGCSNLKYARLEATNLATNCLYYWMRNVAATGILECRQELSLPSGVSGLPSGWSRVDL